MFSRLSRLKRLPNVRFASTKRKYEEVPISQLRNIGILAHIDAGKTTTTERMLYYSGLINHMGEVHHGNTVTDFMSQERERGITITSAAITFYWKKHQFNLIDTPGHIDFTMEVEQTLNVLDGAVVILDGSAGVEAQTVTVWRQADKYNIPRIVFVNKMDRKDASLEMSCKSIENKLQVPVFCLQQPIVQNGVLIGLVDILKMKKILFEKTADRQMSQIDLNEETEPDLWHGIKVARADIIDKLSMFDDRLANLVISSGSLDDISTVDIVTSLRHVTLKQHAVPVLMGSAYKNIGVRPLMDSVILYLGSPLDRNQYSKIFGTDLCARAFKVRHDRQKGPLVFFRVYNGEMSKNQRLYSVQQNLNEQCTRLYTAYADDYDEVDSVQNGNIAVVSGLKKIVSGDLVTGSQAAMQRALKIIKNSGKNGLEDVFGSLQVPEPVFFCSIEPPSVAYQGALEQALDQLQREDPSLRVDNDVETGQTVLSGMGELHLEIIKDRILKEYKIDADLGPLQIAYREQPIKEATDTLIIDTKIANNKQLITVKMSLLPTKGKKINGDTLKFDKSPDSASNIASIFPKHMLAIKQGVEVGTSHGPKMGCKVVNSQIVLHWFEAGRGTSDTMVAAAVTQLVQKLTKEAGTNVLEPVMFLEVVTPDEYLSIIMNDLARRRTEIQNIAIRGNMKVISAEIPLAELLGYSSILRTISSGTATFTIEFNDYQAMGPMDEDAAIRSVRGF